MALDWGLCCADKSQSCGVASGACPQPRPEESALEVLNGLVNPKMPGGRGVMGVMQCGEPQPPLRRAQLLAAARAQKPLRSLGAWARWPYPAWLKARALGAII